MTTPSRIYLAGPMSGLPDHNYPAFYLAAAELRRAGYFVCCPAELNPTDVSYRQALSVDLAWIIAHAEGIALLPGWENSKGTGVELALARAIGIPVARLFRITSPEGYRLGPWEPV